MATGVYIAEQIGKGAKIQIEVYVANPWNDAVPTRAKMLAKIWYDPTDGWSIFAAERAGTQADIEYDQVFDKFVDVNIADTDVSWRKADTAAKKYIIQKYGLPKNWKSPTESNLDTKTWIGIKGDSHDRARIAVTYDSAADPSMTALHQAMRRL